MMILAFNIMPLFVQAETPAWLVAALVMIVMGAALLTTRRRKLDWEGRYGVKVCSRCGGSSPGHAAFCARCGGKLGE